MSDDGTRSSPGFDVLWQTVVSDDANLQGALRRVAETGCSLLANCAASVTIIERGRPITVGSTNDTANTLDDAQYAAREGPCLTAARERRVVRIDDTGNDERWPRFTASARANGVRSSLSVPIVLSGDDLTFAGFNVYGNVVSGFSDDDEQLVQAFAAQASIFVSNAHAYWAMFELSKNLTVAMESRAVIEQAKGILMSTYRIDADAAFDLLRGRSQASNRKLRDVAADAIATATEGDGDASRTS